MTTGAISYYYTVAIVEHPALTALPPTKKILLNALKRSGELGVEDLAARAGLTVSAVRQQLTGLQRDGLIDVGETRGGPGRPRHLYRLTAAADALYPRAYAELTNELLDYVVDADPELMEQIFRRRRQRRIEGARQRLQVQTDFKDKMTELARILDEDGYLAEAIVHEDGTYSIIEHNCAILGIAMRYGQACGSELEFIRSVLPEAKVERVSHMLTGAHNCSYSVKPL
ncbi:MAG TPA: ArsR family transcriptional regulator [Acidimicrobiia bacterium]|nr:ArsR family transcriptional regulator [Acidimicrobiia bacterium]